MDASLESWSDIRNEFRGGSLLLGNGSSRAISNGFGYSSIFEQAQTRIEHPLTREDVALFLALDPRNFEAVLSALQTAELVCRSIGVKTAVIRDRYESIRFALMQAIRSTHVEHGLAFKVLPNLRRELLAYSYVFTTNYDLLVYWAVMAEDGPGPFRDYFWNQWQL
jgi:hypothetical protein